MGQNQVCGADVSNAKVGLYKQVLRRSMTRKKKTQCLVASHFVPNRQLEYVDPLDRKSVV